MNAARNRILEMLSAGKISPDEAEQLLAAVRGPNESFWSWIFRPMDRLQTPVATSIAVAGATMQLAIALLLHVRFYGALDSQPARGSVGWTAALVDLAVAWPITALIFFAAARLFARQGRFVDLLAMVGVARLPLLAAGAIAGANRELLFSVAELAAKGQTPAVVIVIGLGAAVLSAWFITLLVTGLRTASGLRGGRLALAFLAALVVAEAISKVLVSLV